MAAIVGTNGNDTLTDTPENDTIDGLGGSDTLVIAHGGQDIIDGGSGYDTISFYGHAPGGVVFDFGNGRTSNVERLVADSGNDHLIGAAGSQNLSSVGGNDILEGGAGNDSLWSGAGNDQFVFREVGTANADTLGDFASGADKIVLDASVMSALGASGNFAAGDDRFHAAAGATGGADAEDRVIYNTTTRQFFYDADGNGSGVAQLIGTLQSGATLSAMNIVVEGGGGSSNQPTQGDDHLVGTPGDDTIDGLGGNDLIEGLGGNDTLIGGLGEDRLVGGDGNDRLDGRDEVFSSSSDESPDILDGGQGNDTYVIRDAMDTIVADPGGIDTVIAQNMDWTLAAGLENLDLLDTTGSAFDGTGNGLDNVIRGASEGGTLFGMGGNDTLIVRVAQNTGEARGGDGNDILQGGQSRLFGDAGNDLFLTGGGRQSMTGGSGADVFLFEDASSDIFFSDVILDFASNIDDIRLDATGMPALGASGTFAPGDARFAANSSGAAQDSSDRVVYNTSNGELWYDADGSGAGEADLIVTLDGAPSFAATDIEVVNGSSENVITGTPGNDTLFGTPGVDHIDGLGGNDGIFGDEGDDVLIGGSGDDRIVGGHGDDFFDGGPGNDLLSDADYLGSSEHFVGGDGDDRIVGSRLDIMDGGDGNDVYEIWNVNAPSMPTLIDAGGIDTIVVVEDSWTLADGFENLGYMSDLDMGSPAEFVVLAGNAADNVIDARNADKATLIGGAGNDTLISSNNATRFIFAEQPGEANSDSVMGFSSGQDTIVLDGGAHAAIGPSGEFAAGDARFAANATGMAQDASDRVVYNTASGQLWYDANGSGSGGAQLIATLAGAPLLAATDIEVVNGTNPGGEHIVGTSGNDTLTDTPGDDTMEGLGGNDTFVIAHGGEDTIDGGSGWDSISFYGHAPEGVTFDFGNGRTSSVERLLADGGDDHLIGTVGSQNLSGVSGDDTLEGGLGNDSLWGGAGEDTFIFRETGSANADTIGDFARIPDTIALDNAAMAALGAEGTFSGTDGRFWAAGGANSGHDANDRVIYNTSTGQLYYDADGSGGAGAQLIATLSGAPALTASDITVI